MTKGSNYLTSMRCKLRGTVVSVVVMEGNGDSYHLSWDYKSDEKTLSKTKKSDDAETAKKGEGE